MEVAKMDEYISKQAFKEKYLCCGWLPEMSEEEFDAFPAADVVEVRHARWIKHEGYDECEACHVKAIYGSNYCPSCGALMDKEDEHG